MAVEDKFNINLNQNLWGLVVAYEALGVAEHWCLPWLFKLSRIAAIVITISIFFTEQQANHLTGSARCL